MAPTFYLDYDLVLHPADVRATFDEPNRPRVYLRGEPTELPLFENLQLLENLLGPFPKGGSRWMMSGSGGLTRPAIEW